MRSKELPGRFRDEDKALKLSVRGLKQLGSTVQDIRQWMKQVPTTPGVYRWLSEAGKTLYVGKAKNLRNRLSFYLKDKGVDERHRQITLQSVEVSLTVTRSESEALWLEQNYIKQYCPRYNILLQDDKRYPLLYLSKGPFPSIRLHRGERSGEGQYFGPFSTMSAARSVLNLLKRSFPLRQCSDRGFNFRSRPCLNYHLGYCLGPCGPGLPSRGGYEKNVQALESVLSGDTQFLVERLVSAMETASQTRDYEGAIQYRNQIQAVQQLTDRQVIQGVRQEDKEVLGIAYVEGIACVNRLVLHGGSVVEARAHFLSLPDQTRREEILLQFIIQFYLLPQPAEGAGFKSGHWVPATVIADVGLSNKTRWLQAFRSKNLNVPDLFCKTKFYGERKRLLALSTTNAEVALKAHLAGKSFLNRQFSQIEFLWNIPKLQRIDCIDISHLQGTNIIGGCVAFGVEGPLYAEYRAYPIKDVIPGDDCAAMAWTLLKRYQNVPSVQWPELLVVDGGKGQLAAAKKAMHRCLSHGDRGEQSEIPDSPLPHIVAMAKGPTRRSGEEKFFCERQGEVVLPPEVFRLMIRIRDEAHRYAGSAHRKRRSRSMYENIFASIPGIGPVREKKLLQFSGGLKNLRGMSTDQLQAIPGISLNLARLIWKKFHGSA